MEFFHEKFRIAAKNEFFQKQIFEFLEKTSFFSENIKIFKFLQ